jgi:DNA-binding transcriptional LysR family regulator
VRRRVRRNEVDIGFGSRDHNDPELDFDLLFRDQLGLLARFDHPLMQIRSPLRWSNLDGFDFVGLTSDTATGPILNEIPNLPASILSPQYEVSTNSTLWALLGDGIGITTAPALSVTGETGGKLRFKPLDTRVAWRSVYFITRRGRKMSKVAGEIVTRIRSEVEAIALCEPLVEIS